MSRPNGLAFDSSGNLYVANGNNTIEKFDTSGNGTVFNVSGTLRSPQFLAFGPNVASVPEPGSMALLVGMMTAGTGFLARWRKQSA